jgi:Bax protein
MEYWTTCDQEIVEIFCPDSRPLEEGQQGIPSRSDYQESAPGSIRRRRRVVRGGIIAGLIILCIHLNFFMPPSIGSEPLVSLGPMVRLTAPKDFGVSTVYIPTLGKPVTSIEVDSPSALITHLKELELWELEEQDLFKVPPVVFTNFPNQLSELNVPAKKKVFLHSLLPVALVAMAEVEQERTTLRKILRKLNDNEMIDFSDKQLDWQVRLSNAEKAFIRALTEKYRTQKAGELLDRVDVLPVSLVLAQGAFESFWGTSRFAREGNNLFGMWTWGEQGIIPARRDAGKTHKLAIYDSILEAVQNLILTLNRLPAYENLRKLRQDTKDAMLIADGLLYYSERGNAYIKDVKTIIRDNDLTRYDRFVLGDSVELLPALTRLASL